MARSGKFIDYNTLSRPTVRRAGKRRTSKAARRAAKATIAR